MSPRAATVPFAIVLTAAILLRIGLMLAVPFGPVVEHRLEGLNDEPAHLNYVRYLVEHRSLPVQTGHVRDPGAFERGDFEYYQPPLYYLLCAPLVAIAGERWALLLCRALSVAFALLSLPVLSRVLGLLGLGPAERRAGVAFAALLPVHAYFSSLVSNDSLCWLMALLITQELLTRVRGADDDRRTVARGGMEADLRLGVLLGLGMLTKSAIVLFYPVAILVYAMLQSRTRDRLGFAGAALAIGTSLLIAGPWSMRNIALYGSPFALEVGFGPPESDRWSLLAQGGAVAGTVRSFWMPMHSLAGDPAIFALRALGAVLVTLHAIAALAFLARRRPLDRALLAGLLLFGLVVAGHVALNLRWGESEGRFLLPALGPLVFLMVAPAFALAARWRAGERLAWVYLVAVALHPYLVLAFV